MSEPEIFPTDGSRVQTLINIFENHANMQPRYISKPRCPSSPPGRPSSPPGGGDDPDTGWCVYQLSHYKDKCTGPSMLPTVEDDCILLTEHVSNRILYKVNRGDVVVFKSPVDPESFLCKRVVALEFDQIPEETTWRFTRLREYIPRGHVWVEGDNRGNSMDSRCFGPIPLGLVRGRAIFKVWPVRSFGILPDR